MTQISWHRLAARTTDPVRVAVDTEFEKAETLTVQFATLVGRDLVVQLYHAPSIPPPLPGWLDGPSLGLPDGRDDRLVVRPAGLAFARAGRGAGCRVGNARRRIARRERVLQRVIQVLVSLGRTVVIRWADGGRG